MTAVEWLVDELKEPQTPRKWNEIIEQAKEMERQQLEEMYLKGIENYDPTFNK